MKTNRNTNQIETNNELTKLVGAGSISPVLSVSYPCCRSCSSSSCNKLHNPNLQFSGFLDLGSNGPNPHDKGSNGPKIFHYVLFYLAYVVFFFCFFPCTYFYCLCCFIYFCILFYFIILFYNHF